MKGFPNQVADLQKLSQGLRCIAALLDQRSNPRDDGVLGEALIGAGVLGTGHTPVSTAVYLAAQRAKPLSGQGFRTSARGLRELYRLLGLIDDASGTISLTNDGRQISSFANTPFAPPQVEAWRRIIRNFSHTGGDGTESHPYQVLLRLVAKAPGITRAKCALALEAKDDSRQELDRIVVLSRLPEDEIRARIGVFQANWDNAKKVLPRFAEQLGDVVRTGQTYRLADAPGSSPAGASPAGGNQTRSSGLRQPRSSRLVSPETIAMAGLGERDEAALPPSLDPANALAAIRLRADRLRRHNAIVRALATRLATSEMALFEDPFDLLGVSGRVSILAEIKTLDGTPEDERERVRDSLAQLLYYEAFITTPAVSETAIHKISCFEHPISDAHRLWLNRSQIGTVWIDDGKFVGDALAAGMLGAYLAELR